MKGLWNLAVIIYVADGGLDSSGLENASFIENFRPVSMVGCLYKIIAKVMARRLKSVMSWVVSESQSGFIEGRCISDCLITTSFAISWLKRKKKPGALFKIDFRKA